MEVVTGSNILMEATRQTISYPNEMLHLAPVVDIYRLRQLHF